MSATISLGGEPITVDRISIPINNIQPNPDQPRSPEDREAIEFLYSSIRENRGIAQALLVERLGHSEKVRILDGERRWRAAKRLLKEVPDSKAYVSVLPCDVIDSELTKEQRYRVWIYIHRNRKEWGGLVKEKAVIDLMDLVGRKKTADIIGTDIKEVDGIIDTYNLSQRMTGSVKDRAISYARAIHGLPKKFQTEEYIGLLVDKVNSGVITNNVEIRQVKQVFTDDAAKKEFSKPKTTIAKALNIVAESKGVPPGAQKPAEEPEGLATVSSLPEWLREVRAEAEAFQVADFLSLKDNGKLLEEIKAELQSVIDILTSVRGFLPEPS